MNFVYHLTTMQRIIFITSLIIAIVCAQGQAMFYLGHNCEIAELAGVCDNPDDCFNSIPVFLKNQPPHANESYLCTIPLDNKCVTHTTPVKEMEPYYYYIEPIILKGKNRCLAVPGAGECYGSSECNQFVIDMYESSQPKQFVCVILPPNRFHTELINTADSSTEFNELINIYNIQDPKRVLEKSNRLLNIVKNRLSKLFVKN